MDTRTRQSVRAARRGAGLALSLLVANGVSGCATGTKKPADPAAAPAGAFAFAGPTSIVNLHLKLDVDDDTGTVKYFGWYDGRRNLLGPGGVTTGLIGVEPPEVRGQLTKVGPTELRFAGRDQNGIVWEKSWRIEGSTAHVSVKITSRRDDAFDAIVYALPDLPDAKVSGDNRDLRISTPVGEAHFHAVIENPNFPGEQFNPYAMRSESKRLEPGDSMEFRMTWTLKPAGR
ncbi:MAG TPA: hypothetical protein VK986_09030 [Tepidisphaeraceae bacterium]|nr:hypothetical protein [Tepidisphaeraceae bacterium]